MAAELIARNTVHKGRIIEVDVDVVKLPTGHTVDMEIVRHPGSVVLLPIPEPGKIILIRPYRYTIDRWIWELPAGSLKPNEDPDKAAPRECEEEIGLVPHQITRLRGYYPTPGFCDEELHVFLAEGLSPGSKGPDPDEHLEVVRVPLTDALAWVESGRIVDAKTIVGLLRTRERLEREGRWPAGGAR